MNKFQIFHRIPKPPLHILAVVTLLVISGIIGLTAVLSSNVWATSGNTEKRDRVVTFYDDDEEITTVTSAGTVGDALKDAKQMKDNKELSEDEQKRVEKEIDALMAQMQEQLEVAFKAKEKDILTV